MASLVRLRLGNLFDGPSDMVVLPCSTNGTITGFVAQALNQYKMPHPKRSYELGDVDIRLFEGGENIAQYVAFAASVIHMSSTLTAIRSIGVKIGSETQENPSVRRVSAPLLGAGAGGLHSKDVVKSLEEGFKSSAHADAVLTISILHKNVFDRLTSSTLPFKKLDDQDSGQRKVPPRAFISYTGTNLELKKWVVSFASHLRANGIDARLDKWHLRLGMDLPQWMTNEVVMADRVIIISDAQYKAKADGRLGGVAWETMIIMGDMLSHPDSNKYLLIVKEQNADLGTPIYLKSKFSVVWPDGINDEETERLYEDMLKELFNKDLAPPIGPPPVWI